MKAVIDIGKTRLKLVILSDQGSQIESFSRQNASATSSFYPHAETEVIWEWLVSCLKKFPAGHDIKSIIITTHGATAALVNPEQLDKESALVLPVLDYEYTGVESVNDDYQAIRPLFMSSLSPGLPAGLNLGRQLFWLQQSFPDQFSQATHILLYPQYWAWRFSGQLACEVTSLGCHTDLWEPQNQRFSSLVDACSWRELFPSMKRADDCLGTIKPEVARATGLADNCKVYTGIHDSNAGFVRYLGATQAIGDAFTVVSTGTWTILMQSGGDIRNLDEKKDMLANVDVNNRAVCCARFMGGREYEQICNKLGGNIDMEVTVADVQAAIANGWMVTPEFSNGNGPYGGRKPEIFCPEPAPSPQAIATLYCALMVDQRLNDLNARGPVYIEGAFLKNPSLCALVAQLRENQIVYLSEDSTGTVLGASALLADCSQNTDVMSFVQCNSLDFKALETYREAWYSKISE